MPHRKPALVLTLSCADQPGIVAAIASLLAEHNCNITDSAQFGVAMAAGRSAMAAGRSAMAGAISGAARAKEPPAQRRHTSPMMLSAIRRLMESIPQKQGYPQDGQCSTG